MDRPILIDDSTLKSMQDGKLLTLLDETYHRRFKDPGGMMDFYHVWDELYRRNLHDRIPSTPHYDYMKRGGDRMDVVVSAMLLSPDRKEMVQEILGSAGNLQLDTLEQLRHFLADSTHDLTEGTAADMIDILNRSHVKIPERVLQSLRAVVKKNVELAAVAYFFDGLIAGMSWAKEAPEDSEMTGHA